jgi:hypothetical protein
MAAQATVAAIRRGCEMLSQGKQEIQKVKKAVEDAQTILKEAKGIWNVIKGFFSKSSPVPSLKAPEPKAAKPTKKDKAEPLSYEEYQTQMVNSVCDKLKTFFEIQRQLKDYCRELEEKSATDPNIEANSIDRVNIEMQLENMSVQIRETMVYAPQELKDVYSRFLSMYDKILEEQEFQRQVKRKEERDKKWQQDLLRNHRLDRALISLGAILIIVWLWGMLLSLGWLVRTPGGLLSL